MSNTRLVTSSSVRPYGPRAAVEVAQLAAEAQCHGAFLACPWPQDALDLAAIALRGQGLPFVGTALPLAEATLPEGKRLPFWGSLDDPEERLAAINLADQTMARAKDLGGTWAFLDAFPVKLKAPRALFAQCFAENRLDRDRSSRVAARPLMQAALKERAQYDERLFDAARFALERLARGAETRGVTVAVGHGIGPWQFPGPREVDLLLQEFRGAGLTQAHLPARLDVLETLGLVSTERRATLSLAAFVLASDSVGLRDDLAPGLGPRPLAVPLRQPDGSGPEIVVVSGRPDTTVEELKSSVARLRGLVA